ncbi:helix-turn-helix domain-containing protein [Amycolatopsis sp. NPDC001319]|uniref:helix-turn-helix domain-containing protein n=1 Tax=unclassified Amycolatopsis TaxID=2618356 RepID=UPI0036879620
MDKEPVGLPIDGTLLRQLRKLGGDDLVQFAPKVEISIGYLSQIERGHKKFVSPALFARICDQLGVEDRRTLLRKVAA